MKNYVVIGEKWNRAIVFLNELYANSYIEENCKNIDYETYSEAEFYGWYANTNKKVLAYGPNYYMAQTLIILEDNP